MPVAVERAAWVAQGNRGDEMICRPSAIGAEFGKPSRCLVQWEAAQCYKETLDTLLSNERLQRPVDDLPLRLSLGQGQRSLHELLINLQRSSHVASSFRHKSNMIFMPHQV